MKLAIGLAIPMLMIIAGLLLLIGCLPIPATQQLQPNLKPKPDVSIGTEPDKPVRIGYTHIDDAFIEISRRIQTPDRTRWGTSGGYFIPDTPFTDLPTAIKTSPQTMMDHWQVSNDGREFMARYNVRTATFIWPTCATMETAARFIVLTVNSNGVVVAERTLTEKDGRPNFNPFPQRIDRWLEVFDAPTRRKLQAAGVFPTDAQIERLQWYNHPRATTQETSP